MGIIKKQGIQNTIITYFGILIGFVSIILVQPFLLSKEEIGLMGLLFSFSSLVASIIPLGITNIIIRYFPVFRNRETGHYGFLGFVILFPIVGGLLIYFLLTFFKEAIIGRYSVNSALFTDYYNYILPFSIILGFITVLNTYCFSLFKTMVPSLLNDVVNRLLTIGIVYIYFLKLIDLNMLIMLYVLIYVVQLGFLILYMYRVDAPSIKIDQVFMRDKKVLKMIQYGFILSFAAVASLGVKYLDQIMIGQYMAIEFVGIYRIVAFIPQVIEAPLLSLDRIAYAKLSNALATDNHFEIKEIYYKSSKYLLLIGGALFLSVNANIADLLSFLPKDYSAGINVVLIISVGTLINMAGGSNTSIIFNSKYFRIGGVLLVVMAAMALGLNILLIPRFGLIGSAMATAITATFYAVMRYLIILRAFKLQPYDSSMLKVFFLICVGMILSYFIPRNDSAIISIAYRSIIILGFYLAGIYLFNIVPEFHKYIPWKKK